MTAPPRETRNWRCGNCCYLNDATARVCARCEPSAATPAAQPVEPMDWPLPCDVTVGHGTIRKGCKLRTLVARMQVLYDIAVRNQHTGASILDRSAMLNDAVTEQPAEPSHQNEQELLKAIMVHNGMKQDDSVFASGKCPEKRKPGGCQLPNVQCGYPACDKGEWKTQPAALPATDEDFALDVLCDGDPVALVKVPRGVIRHLRAENERQAREIAELKSERDAAQRAGVTTANYWMERAERAEAAFDTMRQSREAAVRLWNDCGEDSQHLVSRLTSITAAADGMRRGEDCPMCDSGKLHDPNKEHWDTCAFAAYDAARSKK